MMDTPEHRSTLWLEDDRADAQLVEHELHRAVTNESLELRHQPLLDRRSGQLVAVDSSIEWHHPTLGTIAPDVFLPMAEATSLIIPIGEWMLWEAFLTAKAWGAKHDLRLDISLDISTQQLTSPTFLATVSDVIDTTEVDPKRFAFVVTGSVDLDDCERVETTVVALRELGLRVLFSPDSDRCEQPFPPTGPLTGSELAAMYSRSSC